MTDLEIQEDLTQNIFFKILKQQFSKLYSKIEKNCWLLCIPKQSSCIGLKITKNLIETHILQESPYFQGEYYTYNKKTVDIEDNYIKTKEGFNTPKVIKILFEELFYNKEYKSFRVLCIESPLEGDFSPDLSAESSNSFYKKQGSFKNINLIIFPENKTYNNCVSFLYSSPVNTIVLTKISQEIKLFNESYVIVKGYENHAIEKVKKIIENTFEALLCANPDLRILHKINNNSQLEELYQIIQSFVIGSLYPRLFSSLCDIFIKEDQFLYSRLIKLQNISLNDLDIREEIQCPLDSAILELSLLDNTNKKSEYITPFEKLHCLQRVNDNITNSISQQLQKQNNNIEIAITTDDLIPLIVYVIIQTKCEKLHSNLYYIENFIFSNINTTSLGFTLVTFQAAVEFIKSDQILKCMGDEKSQLDWKNENKNNRYSSYYPTHQEIWKINLKPIQNSSNDVSLKKLSSHENLSSSTKSKSTHNKIETPPEIIHLKNASLDDNQIGDFLNQLKQDNSLIITRRTTSPI